MTDCKTHSIVMPPQEHRSDGDLTNIANCFRWTPNPATEGGKAYSENGVAEFRARKIDYKCLLELRAELEKHAVRYLLAALMFVSTPALAVEDGKYLYILHCSGCHVRDGSGSAEGRVPKLAGVVGHFEKLPEGRKFILQVAGVMNSGLKDDEVAALMNWLVRNLAGDSLAGPFTPYTPAEVGIARTGRPKDIFAVRRAIVIKLKDQGYEIQDY